MENQNILQKSDTKPCPFCAKPLIINANKCRYCNEFLENNTAIPLKNVASSTDLNKIVLLIGSTLLIFSLFLPWIDFFLGRISPINLGELKGVLGKKNSGILLGIYCLYIPSISGLIALIITLNQNSKHLLKVCCIAAFSATMFVFIQLFSISKETGINPVQLLSTGWYFSLIGSALISIGTYKKYFGTDYHKK